MRREKLLLAALAGIGCSGLNVQITTAPCINPQTVNGQCHAAPEDSRVLELRAYPLKRCANPQELSWKDLQADGPGKPLQLLLTGVGSPDWPQRLLLEPTRSYALALTPPAGTGCLLIVTRGRREGTQSVVQIPLSPFTERITLYVHEFDICVGDTCAIDSSGGNS